MAEEFDIKRSEITRIRDILRARRTSKITAARLQIEALLPLGKPSKIDGYMVENITDDFADELYGKILLKFDPETVKKLVILDSSCNAVVKSILEKSFEKYAKKSKKKAKKKAVKKIKN
jgi:hypothetical protein